MFGFLIALAAGFLTPHAETPLARPIAQTLRGTIDVEESELRLLSFMLMALIAALLSRLLGTGSTLGVVLGVVLGYFATRIVEAARAKFSKSSD